jgi:hypothetical protein
MKAGYLSQYFKGVAAKILSSVEIDLFTSHQHEFNGIKGLMKLFGIERKEFDTKFIYLDDSDDEPVSSIGKLTWYDAREAHPTRTEHRLYFPTTQVSTCAAPGDLMVIGLRPDDTVLVIICEKDSTICNQVLWLFGISDLSHPGFSIRGELESEQDKIAFTSTYILEQIGIEVKEEDTTYLDEMLSLFGGNFPKTSVFSDYARSKIIDDIDAVNDPDSALMACMDKEEILFRTLEKHLVAEKLNTGFNGDVEEFFSWSLSIQNRRKSRVGYALENHMENILIQNKIRYDRTKITENKSKPDFIFPSIKDYHDMSFNVACLTMLGAKSTCKERWRQVLSEAKRILNKHLLTLEAAISENQTNEMMDSNMNLVIPATLFKTYTIKQQKWLMNISDFISLVRDRQLKAKQWML